MSTPTLFGLLLVAPFAWLFAHAVCLAARRRVPESLPLLGLKTLIPISTFLTSALMYRSWEGPIHWTPGEWLHVPGAYVFPIELVFTPVLGSVALAMLLLVAVIVKYSESYLHKEPGFQRFFLLLAAFQSGFPLVLYADNIDILFMGWEIIGVTSVLLIGFYEQREAAVQQSWWALSTYRACDMGLLAATALAHFAVHTTSIPSLNAPTELLAQHSEHGAWLGAVAACLVFASLGKAAQLPFVSWITRAMEGPTPSSALYYGALSVSLGPVLLLKFQGLILHYDWLRAVLLSIGALTALYAYLVSKTRSDAKSLLAFSAVFEVSVMVVEVALGLHKWVVFHLVANAFMRMFQFLRSMNAIHDFYDNPLFYRGAPDPAPPWVLRFLGGSARRRLYYAALNGFGLDWLMINGLVRPWLRLWEKVNAWENRQATGKSE